MSQLFSVSPSLQQTVVVSYAFETVVERQSRGGETRSGLSAHVIRGYGFDYLLEDEEAQSARQFLENLGKGLVHFPDWTQPAKVVSVGPNRVEVNGGEGNDWRSESVWFVPRFNRYGGFEVQLDSYDGGLVFDNSPVLDGDLGEWLVYPIRRGRISSLPTINPRTDEMIGFRVDFLETIDSLVSGAEWDQLIKFPEYKGRPVLDLFWKNKTEDWESGVSFERAGLGLETAFVREREQKRKFSFEVYQHGREEIYSLVQFFDLMRGRLGGFWLPGDVCSFSLAEAPDEGASSILLKGTDFATAAGNRVGYGDLQIRQSHEEDEFLGVESVGVEGENTRVNLQDPLSRVFSVEGTSIGVIHFVRFASDTLTLDFETDEHARSQLSFIELPWEYEAAGDTFEPVYLYEISGFIQENWTSHGIEVTSNGTDYSLQNIGHGRTGQTEQSLAMKCDVTIYPGSDSPLFAFRSGFPLEPMEMVIKEVSRNDLETQRVIHRGKVRNLSYLGKGGIKLALGSPGDAAETEIPRAYIEPRCSRSFLKVGCNLLEADFEVVGVVDFVSERNLSADEILTESTNRGFADWFVHGRVKIGNEIRSVVAQIGDTISVSVPFLSAKAGDAFTLIPGCNRTVNHCTDRYNNFQNYGGAPFVPTSNPQLETLRIETSTGDIGKK